MKMSEKVGPGEVLGFGAVAGVKLGGIGLASMAIWASSANAQCPDPASPTASYEVAFDAEWSQATHPQSFPGNPHFSPLIGGTHDGGVMFWEPGGQATIGIERVAETGNPDRLRAEVNAAIADGTAGFVIEGGALAVSPGQVLAYFDVTESHPLVTLVTMIAPSPDWFVGVHGLDLRPGGEWADSVTVELWAYDSGTDSGTDYTSANSDTDPAEPIQNIHDEPPFAGTGRIGTYTFVRVDGVGCSIADIAPPCGVHDFLDIAAYLALYNSDDPAADVAEPYGLLNFFDVSSFISAFTGGCP